MLRQLAGGAALASLLLIPAPAFAEPPVEFPPGEYLLDTSDVLSPGQEADIEEALAELRNTDGVGLHVAFVPDFSEVQDPGAWVAEAAELNALSTFDGILAIATEQRNAQLDLGSAFTSEQEQTIRQEVLAPELNQQEFTGGDWVSAAVATTEGVADAAGGGSGNPNDGGGLGTAITVVLVLAALGIGGYIFIQQRKSSARRHGRELDQAEHNTPADPLAALSVDELRRRAGSLLIACDDAIKTSEQEVAFAQAQYGNDAVQPFVDDIAKAKRELGESFKMQQQLDDAIPDTEEQQREWFGKIIRNCERANSTLGEHKADFDALRELERNAPAALRGAREGAAAARARVREAEESLATMRERYADRALKTVADNIDQANERLEFVETAAETAEEKLAAADTSSAVVAVRAAEESVQQTNLLLDAIERVSVDLQQASTALTDAVSEIRQDLATARAISEQGGHPELAGPIAGAEAALSEAQRNRESGKADPIAALQRVEEAHHHLDEALTGVRDQQEQDRRSRAALEQAVMSARAQISATSDYITARRGGVGSEARTRLAEAQRNLDYALSIAAEQPSTALQHAHQANVLGSQAGQLAQSDVEGFGGYGYRGGDMFSGGRRGGSGMGGAVLGGILIGSILNGGGGGGFGGFGGGGFGGGDFGGGFDGGGFGGFDGGAGGSF